MKGYLQLKLDSASAEKLKKKAIYPKVFCHHITVIFGVSDDDERVQELLKIGEMVIKGKEIYTDEKGQALSVDMLSDFVSLDNKQVDILKKNGQKQNYHITISTQEGVPPVYSNELLKNSKAETEPYTEILRGTLEFFKFGK
jgi:hypothetical protein